MLFLSTGSLEVRADSNASGVCGTGQICNINLASNGCMRCNSTGVVYITNVQWFASNKTLTFTANGDPGVSATNNVTIPKGAVLNQNSANIKVYVKGSLLPNYLVKIKMNSTAFFTAFNVTFASPVSAAISLGIIGVTAFPLPSLVVLGTLFAISIPKLRKPRHNFN